ncbi:MAG: GPW/gp25 family protein [Rhodocyclaceae bacterium]|nr:GPW/gp25 family protein [Rhodocyclaceae bacterium]
MHGSSFLGTGWSFPPAFDRASDRLRMVSGESNIKQSIDLLLRTSVGSRCLLPAFGCALNQYIFRQVDATVRAEIIATVKQTLLDYEPRIIVERTDIREVDGGAMIELGIGYLVKQTNTRHNHVFPFSLVEGTNLSTASRALP